MYFKICVLILIISIVGINAEDCNFDYQHLKEPHLSFFDQAFGYDYVVYKEELGKLINLFTEYQNSITPECFESERGVRTRNILNMFFRKFNFLNTLSEAQKNVYFNQANVECLSKESPKIIKCIQDAVEPEPIDFCQLDSETNFSTCVEKSIQENCNESVYGNFESFKELARYAFNYSKENEFCGPNHIVATIFNMNKRAYKARNE